MSEKTNPRPSCRCGPESKVALEDQRDAPLACPGCGNAGKTVPANTVRLHVKPDVAPRVSATGHRFCETPDCPIVYYGGSEGPPLRKDDVLTRVGVKETEDPVPVCYCFAFTERQVGEDVLANGRSTIRDYIKDRSATASAPARSPTPPVAAVLETWVAPSTGQ